LKMRETLGSKRAKTLPEESGRGLGSTTKKVQRSEVTGRGKPINYILPSEKKKLHCVRKSGQPEGKKEKVRDY